MPKVCREKIQKKLKEWNTKKKKNHFQIACRYLKKKKRGKKTQTETRKP